MQKTAAVIAERSKSLAKAADSLRLAAVVPSNITKDTLVEIGRILSLLLSIYLDNNLSPIYSSLSYSRISDQYVDILGTISELELYCHNESNFESSVISAYLAMKFFSLSDQIEKLAVFLQEGKIDEK